MASYTVMSTFAPQTDIPAPPTSCEANSSYNVKKGDTCYAIARAYDLTPADILQANPQMSDSCDLVYIDQVICLPTGPAASSGAADPSESSSAPIPHTTASADDQSTAISDRPATFTSTTAGGGSIEDSSSPSTSTAADNNACALSHTVVAGDTCHDTWTKYSLSEEGFLALNPHLSIRPDGYCGIAVGDVVCVAGSSSGSPHPKDPSDQVPKKMSALSVVPISDDAQNNPTSLAAVARRWLPVTFQTSTVRETGEE